MYTLHIMKGYQVVEMLMSDLFMALCIYAFPVSIWCTSFGISELMVKGK
jgi:hypothetical protein